MITLGVAVAGAFGAVLRFVVDGEVKQRVSVRAGFPIATIGINVSGSFVVGLIAGLVIFRSGSSDFQTVIGTGFCGGYTTFSTAAVETVRLLQQGRKSAAATNALGTLVASVAACGAGLALASIV